MFWHWALTFCLFAFLSMRASTQKVLDKEENVNKTEEIVNITCPDPEDSKDNNVTVQQVLGEWFAVEIYLHLQAFGKQAFHTCPKITIKAGQVQWYTVQPNAQNRSDHEPFYVERFISNYHSQYRGLRLVWDEAGQDVEYSLHFQNDTQGYWMTAGGQTGSLVNSGNYRRFEGVVQVLKAVENHILLNFCQSNPPQLFSILLSREPQQLHRWEINAAHELLRRRQLSIHTRRLVCGNGVLGLRAGFLTTFMSVVFVTFLKFIVC